MIICSADLILESSRDTDIKIKNGARRTNSAGKIHSTNSKTLKFQRNVRTYL